MPFVRVGNGHQVDVSDFAQRTAGIGIVQFDLVHALEFNEIPKATGHFWSSGQALSAVPSPLSRPMIRPVLPSIMLNQTDAVMPEAQAVAKPFYNVPASAQSLSGFFQCRGWA